MAEISRASDHVSVAATHLIKGISDSDADVAAACLTGLARLGPAGKAGLPSAIEALKSKDAREKVGKGVRKRCQDPFSLP